MSNKAIKWVLSLDYDATPATKFVHTVVANTVNPKHGWMFWKSRETVARECNISVRSAGRALAWLVEHGYLVPVGRSDYDTVKYLFIVPGVTDSRRGGDSPPVTAADEVGQNVPGEGGSSCPMGEDMVSCGVGHGVPQNQKNPIEPKNPKTPAIRRPKRAPQPAATLQPDKPAAPHLELLPPPPPNPAHTLCRHVWDHKTPKPATPFIAAVKIAERLIGAGHDPDAVRDAMLQAPTLTTSSIEIALARHRPTTPSIEDSWDRSQPSGEIVW